MNLPVEKILKIVCDYHEVKPEDIFKYTRKREIVLIRQLFHYLAYKHSKRSLDYIGNVSTEYGRKKPHDHATVRNSRIAIENLLFYDKRMIKIVGDILNQMKKIDGIEYIEKELLFKEEIDDIRNRLERLEKLTA